MKIFGKSAIVRNSENFRRMDSLDYNVNLIDQFIE